MDKLKMHSVNKVDENIKKMGELFPNILTEVIKGYREDGSAIIEHAIDFDVLRQELSNIIVEGPEERYQFTWPEKRKSILLANAPIAKTFRPCREESVDFDSTENLYIEGDNLDALKLLQETYLGKVKMIFIDPPYNTGSDLVYDDDFSQDTNEYLSNSGQYDELGNRLVQNNESNGRFHTDWLNMIYPRLKVAKDLLTDDGVIFISIDDHEVENLKKICNEVFGVSNFVATIIWQKVHTRKNSARYFSESHDYIICIAKHKQNFNRNLLPRENTDAYQNPDNDPNGRWKADPIYANNPYDADYIITKPNGVTISRPSGRYWRYSEKTIQDAIATKKIIWGHGNSYPMLKRYLSDVANGLVPITLFDRSFAGDNMVGNNEVKEIFGVEKVFTYPKPTLLIKRLMQIGTNSSSIILDFFSGSSTTAHAVMQLNAEDGGNRKFIMVQLPEETDDKSEAFKAGYKNICEIGKERIRRAGKKILKEHPEFEGKLDIGFRVLKLNTTNMQDVYYNPSEYSQGMLLDLEDNIKPDRTSEDLLFQVMLDLGVLLDSKIEETVIGGKKVLSVADGYLMACFESNVTSEVISEIAKKQPYYAVFRDSSMASDSVATNFEQIFQTYSPTTIRKVL